MTEFTVPYDRAAVAPAIVHFGVGGFHRAHEAMYLDRLLRAGGTEWGICGVGVRPEDAAMRDALAAQDGSYTLVTVAPDATEEAQTIGSIVTYLFAPDDPEAVSRQLASPSTRIVSLTITEGGYEVSDATGEFAPTDAATLADLDAPDAPRRSVLGFLVRALAERRAAGTVPFTVMSCDNIPGNGQIAKVAVVGFAARLDPGLAAWIDREVAFPNSMVDRITPATTDAVRAEIEAAFGIRDRWPVRSESFAQWVLEDAFTAGRPPLEDVGVQLVPDVVPYELMKLRMLNASHQVMSHVGILAGLTTVDEACGDPQLGAFVRDYMTREAIPTLPPVPGIDLERYRDQLLERFGSAAVRDTLARQIVDASDRIPKFLLPVIRAQLAAGGDIRRAVLVLAAWSICLDPAAPPAVPPVDRRLAELRAAAVAEAADPGSFLDLDLFGGLGQDARLRSAFVAARAALRERGPRAVLTDLVGG
ncbi:mannitol dehydrogenase family protein [Microbacterium mangrovi]|uniref:mannitol dehydrogenase family protein n=1 Tax=Microbacterium mangrovi TaxID=1348253 RepID=UPI000AF2562F|nr:mannitol dehydrogenase family protein [Microbacterium mangrovi]